MIIELKILNDLAEERIGKDEDGEEYTYTKVIKRNIITKKLINTNSISSIAETLTKKGVPYKSRCIIYIKEEGYSMVKHSYEEMKRLIGHNKVGYNG